MRNLGTNHITAQHTMYQYALQSPPLMSIMSYTPVLRYYCVPRLPTADCKITTLTAPSPPKVLGPLFQHTSIYCLHLRANVCAFRQHEHNSQNAHAALEAFVSPFSKCVTRVRSIQHTGVMCWLLEIGIVRVLRTLGHDNPTEHH